MLFSNISKEKRITFALFLCIAFANLSYMFWDVLKYKYNINEPFYKLDAIAWVLMVSVFFYSSINFIIYRPLKYVSMWGLYCVINNFLDETLYQNINLMDAEIDVFYFITIALILSYLRHKIKASLLYLINVVRLFFELNTNNLFSKIKTTLIKLCLKIK